MKIQKQLDLSALISLAVIAVALGAFFWSAEQSRQSAEDLALSDQIKNTLFERTMLRDEYFIHHEDRPRQQWRAKTGDLAALTRTAAKRFSSPGDQATLAELAENFDATAAVFSALVEQIDRTRPGAVNPARSEEYQKRLFGQLLFKSYALRTSAAMLHESLGAAAAAARRRAQALLGGCLVLVAAAALVNGTLIGRTLRRRLRELRQGTEAIGGGNLDYRLPVRADDELSELASATNDMAARLKLSCASLETLQLEMAERQRAQTALRESEERLLQFNTQLEQRVQDRTLELQAANHELEAFSYSVSHDLRAPLRAVDGYARILAKNYAAALDAEGRRLLEVVRSEAGRMGELIDDLLAFSRLSRQPLNSQDVDLGALAQTVFGRCAAQAPGRQFEFILPSLPPVRGDAAMLRQALENLLSNAVKYTRTRPVARIELGVAPDAGDPGLVTFFVRDNGVGFDMKYAHKLFGVFQRLHGEEEFEGTGVGLALVQRILHRHGGKVWAEARLDEGATFFFTLGKL